MPEPRWLTSEEQQAWRSYLHGSMRLLERLDRDLRDRHDLSLTEYEILVRLSEASNRSLRMADLAERSSQSRSRLSHTIGRLEHDQLVRRISCTKDGRGVYAQLTEAGLIRMNEAARTHESGVREYLVDPVGENDFAAIGRAFGTVINLR